MPPDVQGAIMSLWESLSEDDQNRVIQFVERSELGSLTEALAAQMMEVADRTESDNGE